MLVVTEVLVLDGMALLLGVKREMGQEGAVETVVIAALVLIVVAAFSEQVITTTVREIIQPMAKWVVLE